jgi:hypothetical protein
MRTKFFAENFRITAAGHRWAINRDTRTAGGSGIDDLLPPIELFLAARERALDRRVIGYVTKVCDFARKPH